jgi:hypothetical protein
MRLMFPDGDLSSSTMGKKPIVVGVFAIIALFILITNIRIVDPSVPKITLQQFKNSQSGGVVTLAFTMTNETADSFLFYPFEVQAHNGTSWKECFRFQNDFRHLMPTLTSYAATNYTFELTNLPNGVPLRLVMHVQETLTGFRGFLKRCDLRLSHRLGSVSLTSFWKGRVFAYPTEIPSQDFIEPPVDQNGHGTSEK